MKKVLFLSIILFSSILSQTGVIEKNGEHYFSNTVVIKLKEATTESFFQSKQLQQLNPYKIEQTISINSNTLLKGEDQLKNIYTINYLSSEDPETVSEKLKKLPGVLWTEPKYIRQITYKPNDSLYVRNHQKNLERIYADSAWSITKGDTNVVIAIVDTGVDWTHPDLASNIYYNRNEIAGNGVDEDDGGLFPDDIRGWDFGGANGTPDNNPKEDESTRNAYHGTHVAGIASAVTDNSIGIASIGFNCRILPVKVSRDNLRDARGYALITDGYNGIKYAADKGAKVINCSWGGYTFSQLEQDIINYAISKGALVVASAGNDGSSAPFYPASYKGVLSVGWLNTDDDTRSSQANYGIYVDVMSPGTFILSTWQKDSNNNQMYNNFMSGSSMSSPLVAGLAGLVFSKFSSYSPLQIAEQIRMTADNVDPFNPGYELLLGRGRINANRALKETNNSSVRAINFVFAEEGNGNGFFQSGEYASIEAVFQNFLTPLNNLNITLSSLDQSVEIVQPNFSIASLHTLETTSNQSNKFRIRIKNDAPIDHLVTLKLSYQASGYSDFQLFTLKINIPIETHTTGKISMTVTSKGVLGFNDYSQNTEGIGFRFMNGSNLMFEGAFMYGTSADKLMDGARNDVNQSKDFKVVEPIKFTSPGLIAFQEGYSNFDDSGVAQRLGISTHFYSYSFNSAPDDSYIILRTALRNTTQQTISNLYAGFFIDWDIPEDDYANNTMRYDNTDNFAYTYNTNNPSVYVGTALISHNNYNYYPINNSASSGEVILFDANGFTDSEKFISLSSGILNASPVVSDISHVVSGGPFSIAPNQTTSVAYVIAAASNLTELRNAIKQSRIKYQSIPTDVEETKNNLPNDFVLYQNYPNPFNPTTVISYQLPARGWVTLKVFDVLGKEIATIINENKEPGTYVETFHGTSLPSGIYFYKLEIKDFASPVKFIDVKKMVFMK